MAKLTTRTLATGVTTDDLIHIVITGDTSQDPDGSSYKASIKQVFDAITGYCISDLYVSNIHSCSPLNINPLDEGNVYFGSQSGVTIDLLNSGCTLVKGNVSIQSDSLDLGTIIAQSNTSGVKGNVTLFSHTGLTGGGFYNTNTLGRSTFRVGNSFGDNKKLELNYFGASYVRPSTPITGINFYQNKAVLVSGRDNDGMVINIQPTGNTGNLWFEQNGNSIMYLKGGPNPSDGSLGLKLNPDGTEEPTANLQIGGTGTTGTFKYVDGNQTNGYVLTSDGDGNATWQPSSGSTSGTTFTGGSGNCITDFYVTNIHGCSPISIWDEVQLDVSNAYGYKSFSLGKATYTYGVNSFATGINTEVGSNRGYLVSGCTGGMCILDSSYGNVTTNFSTGSTSYIYFDDDAYGGYYPSNTFSVSAKTFDGTYTIIYLNQTYVDTFGNQAIISDTQPPLYWGGDQQFAGLAGMANGDGSASIGKGSNANGGSSSSIGLYSNAEGSSIAYGSYSHSEGQNTRAGGNSSHAEGFNSLASGDYSHAEGQSTASGFLSHAEGDGSTASGQYAHSQNKGSIASGDESHAGGFGGKATGAVSFSHGMFTEANGGNTVTLGGDTNIVTSGVTNNSAILGGSGNTITYVSPTDDVSSSVIIGGSGNTVNSFESVIVGGEFNTISGSRSVVLGGSNINAIASDTAYVPNFVITKSYTPTGSGDLAGEPGSITWDSTYLYYKTNTGWRRINGSTF